MNDQIIKAINEASVDQLETIYKVFIDNKIAEDKYPGKIKASKNYEYGILDIKVSRALLLETGGDLSNIKINLEKALEEVYINQLKRIYNLWIIEHKDKSNFDKYTAKAESYFNEGKQILLSNLS